MDRAEKREFVTSMHETLQGSGTVVVAHYTGLTVAQMNDYRTRMRNAGGFVKVAKNRLMKLALEGTDAARISNLFEGQTLIAYSDDPVTAAKVSQEFARTNQKLVILGGAMGAQALDSDGVKALADMPSLDELRAKLVGTIQTPATRVAGVVQAPAGQLARVMQAYADKGEAA